MRRAAYQHLIDGLADITASPEAKRQFADLIRRCALNDGVSALDRSERVKFARQLLDQREPRATINRRLMAKYGIGRSQAYQVIAAALQVSGFS